MEPIPSGSAERHLDLSADDAHCMCDQAGGRGRTEHAAVAHVEGSAVQRAHQSVAAQAALAKTRVGMGAGIVESEPQSLSRPAHHDLPAFHRGGPQLGRLELVSGPYAMINARVQRFFPVAPQSTGDGLKKTVLTV